MSDGFCSFFTPSAEGMDFHSWNACSEYGKSWKWKSIEPKADDHLSYCRSTGFFNKKGEIVEAQNFEPISMLAKGQRV